MHFDNNDLLSDQAGPNRLHKISVCILLAAGWLAACEDAANDSLAPETAPGTGILPEAAATSADCGESGRLETELYGTIAGAVTWPADTLTCDGMPRPNGAGARLRFAGTLDDSRSLAIIIALPALEEARAAAELPSNVTLIEEGTGRFFSTPGLESCWTDVLGQTALDDGRYRIDGKLYCIAPLVEVNGEGSVNIRELRFTGRVDWDAS